MPRDGAAPDPELEAAWACLATIKLHVERHTGVTMNEASERRSLLGIAEPVGVKVLVRHGQSFVVVANNHLALAGLLAGTEWATLSMDARGTVRTWVKVLRRLPRVRQSTAVRFGGRSIKTTIVPLEVWDRASFPRTQLNNQDAKSSPTGANSHMAVL